MLAVLAPAVLLGGASAAVAQDVTPPTLVSYSVSPAVVDVTTGDATLDITTQFTDDLSGFESAAVLYSAPGFVSLALAEIDATHRTSGDALSGTYMTSIVIPEYSKAGTWTVFSFNARDVQGNSTATPPAPASANFDVVSNEDLGAPSLVSIGASQSAIDVTTNPVDVTLTLQITDDISGFEQADVNLESPSGLESVFLTLDASDLIAGNALNGTYQRNAPFPQLSEAGTWIVESVMLRDAYGYSVTIPNASLPSPPTVDVSFSPDSVAPTLVSLSVDPSSVSLWAGPRTITFGVHLTDDVSGVASAGALLGSPVQEESKVIVFDAAHRISGDKFDGVYEVPVEFAAGDTLGAWTIEVYANDVATNYIQSSGGALPGPSVFFVSNAPPPPLPALGILSLVALASALAGAGALTVGKR
jgi:hypothetical protein